MKRLEAASAAFRLMIATSWLAPDAYRKNQDEAIRAALEAGPDWDEYLHLIGRHGTPGVSWASLSRVSGTAILESVAEQLRRRSDACRRQAVHFAMILAGVLRRFNDAGIPVMPLKGPALSLDIYGDVGLRYSRDLDVEVQKDDLKKAQACLEGGDWKLESTFFSMSPRQWESFLRHEQHINFLHSRTRALLEVHWRMQWETPGATASRWARSIPVQWQKLSILTMHPGDMALYLCSHGGLHVWFRAKWLGDLARAHTLGLLDWEASFNDAKNSGQERVILAGLSLLREVYGLTVPELPRSVTRSWSPLLVDMPIRALMDPAEPASRVGPAKLRNRMRLSRYERLLWPRKTGWKILSDLFYSREDFRTLALPDRFFWVYRLLRPFLWVWRWANRAEI
jgi:hypothetical protein